MISVHDLKKALLNQSVVVSDANSFLLIPNGLEYTPDPNATYVTEITLTGDDNSPFLADDSCDTQFGIYQLSIYTPIAKAGGAWTGSLMSDIYKAGFSKGTELTYNAQMVRVVRSSSIQNNSLNTDTHYATILSITYSVIN